LAPDDAREIDVAVAEIADPSLRSAARRLMTKARQAGALALVLVAWAATSGCAGGLAMGRGDESAPLRSVAAPPSKAAEGYYYYSLAQLHTQAGRFKDALAAIQEAVKRDPDSAYLWREQAQLLARAEQPNEAVTAARRAVELDPQDPANHLALAELLRGQRKFTEAEAELEKVIALNPDAEEPYLTLARYYVEQKSYDKARAVLLRLAERQPRLAQAQFLLGRLAIETENYDEAITRLSRAVDLDPDHDGAWTALGYAYEAKRQPEKALEVYRRAVKSNADNPAFVERLADLLIRMGRFQEAQSEVEALTELAPRDGRLWMKLGAVYYEQKLWEKSADAFRRAVLL
ncbi:MAG TPA: tetratricopeptide repeat protein, partial [Solirubrobacterales bacterium]|nr:tetratricopeptide repeat protein [Solirubrobacterales bacterium]